MKFKLDENLGHSVAAIFRDRGHEASTVPEQGLCSSPDREIFDVCGMEKYCLVTLDRDFSNILNFPPHLGCGIVVLRLPGKASLPDIRDLVGHFLDTLGKDSLDGKLWIVEKNRVREYQEEED